MQSDFDRIPPLAELCHDKLLELRESGGEKSFQAGFSRRGLRQLSTVFEESEMENVNGKREEEEQILSDEEVELPPARLFFQDAAFSNSKQKEPAPKPKQPSSNIHLGWCIGVGVLSMAGLLIWGRRRI